MRTLTYFVATTIDGFIADPAGNNPAEPGGIMGDGGDHIDAIVAEYPEILPTPAREALGVTAENRLFDTVLEGRGSYEIGLRAGITNAYRHLRHIVFSRTIAESPDPTVEITSDDPLSRVKELKQEDGGGIWLVGGGRLAQALRPEIDQLIVKLNPVAIGSGIPLFGGEFRPQKYRLTATRVFDSGVVFLTYVRAPG
ncbi:Dihydrofolate reductase [Amycolatopsis arida]|uniref:Dihydrofolate reductase n=1 Tax=Amycolatopsis arida TaxID=587909 RepID=A0A1I5ZFH7_9PSEU|nr:dihydrofolate reductase family protein [Amycolatopsis arida]TDX89628.1 dihydrofolate reductase [Amycolatopsis arida]SFQ55224.1 Dihydrofolate reductase [Amycolatopsis arida]